MSFPRYPAYKDSVVEWCLQLPEDWAAVRLGFECETVVPMRDKPESLDGDIPWIRIEDFDGQFIYGSKSGQGVDEATVRAMNLKVFPAGAVLCSCSCSMGATAIVGRPLVTNQTFIGIVPGKRFLSPFLYYAFQSSAEHLQSIGTGAIQTYLARDDFRRLRMPCPPLAVQEGIVAFLDRETAKIDALIGEQQRLIDLLKGKRQAVISHAVTKGLNPDAPMKSSGVEWLGEVPAHWDTKRLRHVSEVTVGIVVEPSKLYVDEGIPALRSLNVRPGRIRLEDLVFISPEANQLHVKSKLRTGDVVAVRSGQPGAAAVVPASLDGCNCIDLLIIRKPSVGSEHYLCWYLASDVARAQFEIGSGGAIQQHFNVGTALNLLLPVPPPDEQEHIAEFVEREVGAIDSWLIHTEQAVRLLQERRTALISAAVTGQIDVRKWPEAGDADVELAARAGR